MKETKFRTWHPLCGMSDKIEVRFAHGIRLVSSNDLSQHNAGDDKFILMQYTGLKDKKGTEIYEGDIVKVGETTMYRIGWYAQNAAFWIFTTSGFASEHYIANSGTPIRNWNLIDGGRAIYFHGQKGPCPEVEVIGNIYENPELLK